MIQPRGEVTFWTMRQKLWRIRRFLDWHPLQILGYRCPVSPVIYAQAFAPSTLVSFKPATSRPRCRDGICGQHRIASYYGAAEPWPGTKKRDIARVHASPISSLARMLQSQCISPRGPASSQPTGRIESPLCRYSPVDLCVDVLVVREEKTTNNSNASYSEQCLQV